MSLANIAEAAAGRLLGMLTRYLVPAVLAGIFGLVALYHFTVAGMLALEIQFGALYARLIVAGVYTVLTLTSAGVLWILARKATRPHPAPDPTPRHIQLAALIEALILGYEVSRKDRRAR
jgi:predicted anti-sigma-YlaC factor YlaD